MKTTKTTALQCLLMSPGLPLRLIFRGCCWPFWVHLFHYPKCFPLSVINLRQSSTPVPHVKRAFSSCAPQFWHCNLQSSEFPQKSAWGLSVCCIALNSLSGVRKAAIEGVCCSFPPLFTLQINLSATTDFTFTFCTFIIYIYIHAVSFLLMCIPIHFTLYESHDKTTKGNRVLTSIHIYLHSE